MSDDWLRIHGEADRAFGQGTVCEASEEQLQRYLQNICTGAIPNDTIRHREIVRGITINHIQTARVIKELGATIARLNAQNARTERWIVVLAIASLVATLVGIFT